MALDYVQKYAPGLYDHFGPVNSTQVQNDLYGDVDLFSLNWLERTWGQFTNGWRNDVSNILQPLGTSTSVTQLSLLA